MSDRENQEAVAAPVTKSTVSVIGSTQEIVRIYTRCGQCGGNLHFRHSTDFSRNLTTEHVSCPECGKTERRNLHRLQ